MRHLPALLVALAALGQPLRAETPRPDAAAFFEDFTEGLDRGRWYVSDGWTNGDWQDCHWSAGAVRVQDGTLTLFHIPAPEDGDRPAQCGEVQTRAPFGHGTVEARIRTPRAPGLNASVFTYTGPVHGAPHDEIDIEILTRDPGAMTVNTYVAGKPRNGGAAPANRGVSAIPSAARTRTGKRRSPVPGSASRNACTRA